MAVSDNLIVISFTLSATVLWMYRGIFLDFVRKRIVQIREILNSAQRQRLESLMRLKQARSRGVILANEGSRLVERSREEESKIALRCEQVVNNMLTQGESRTLKLASSRERLLVHHNRKVAVETAVEAAMLLLKLDSAKLNNQERVKSIIGTR